MLRRGYVLAAPEKLHALLEIVRLTVTREGVSVTELATSLGLSTKKVREAVSLLSVIGVPPYRPDQLLDIFVDDDEMVYCDLDQGLAIEPRLSVEECEALALALRWASPHSRQILDDLLDALPHPISDVVRSTLAGFGQAIDEEEFASVETIQDAIERHNGICLYYFSASRQSESHYELVPWKLLHFETGQYLWAGIRETGEGRLFRLDRIRGVEAQGLDAEAYLEPMTPPKNAQPKNASEAELEILVEQPALFEYLERLGAERRGANWVIPYATSSWVMSCLRELTGKVRVVGPEALRECYQTWLLETLQCYDTLNGEEP